MIRLEYSENNNSSLLMKYLSESPRCALVIDVPS